VSPILVAFRLGHKHTRMIEHHYERLVESMDQAIPGTPARPPSRNPMAPGWGPRWDQGPSCT